MPARDRTANRGSPGGQAGALAGLPPELATAINRASSQYGVPAGTLAGIWRIESGSSFPNPYVNSIGYGGLFGTHNWNASTQEQANTAASILANLLRQYNGDMSSALYHYSGGGYTSVPGGPTGPTHITSGRGSRPSGGGGGGGIGGFLGGLGHDIASPFEQGWSAIAGGVGDVVGFLKAAAWLVDPRNWLRVLEVLTGFALIIVGLFELASAADSAPKGSASSTIGNAVGLVPAGRVLKGVKGAQTARKVKQGKKATQAARAQRTAETDAERRQRREDESLYRSHRIATQEHKAKGAKARAEIERARATREKRKTRAGQPAVRARRAAAQSRAERKRGVDIFGAPLGADER